MSLASGSRLGPYEIVAPVGAGGMGEVYKAVDTRLDRVVAIKVSPAQFSERFEREARAVAALNHPNICQLYDVGPNYLVMEYIEGSPLALVESARKLLDLAVQIADGLAAAHASGIVHRDLKPENILVTRDGRVKILDFGLAKAAASAQVAGNAATVTNLTDPGMAVGTICYMSPEQARGEPNLTFQSDQFSFGLVLYKMASGTRAFERSSAAETMTAIIREEAEPLPATVPVPLRWVVERLLAKEPGERYDSTRDLYRELKQIRDRLSLSTAAVREMLPAGAARRRSRVLEAAGAAAALAVLASIFLLFSRRAPSGPDLSHYKFTRVAPGETEERDPAWSPDGNSIAYSARVHGVRQIFERGVGSHQAAQLTKAAKDCLAPIWSPDGESIYYLAGGNLWAVPASGGAERLVLERVEAAAIHPRGKMLAFARDGKLWLAAVAGGAAKEFWPGPLAPATPTTSMCFSPDGSSLAFDNGTVWVFSYPSGQARKLYTGVENGSPAGVVGVSWFPDGRSLLVARNGPTDSLVRLTLADGSRETIYSAGFTIMAPAVSPDGKRIAYSAGEYEWNVVEIGLADGAAHVLVENGGSNTSPDWSPSGTHFLYSGQGAVMDQDAAGGEFSRRLIDTSYDPGAARWSPDGARFVFVDNGATNKLMLATAAGGHATLLDQADDIRGLAWSPDGQWISYCRLNEGQPKLAKIRSVPGTAPVLLADAPGVRVTQWSAAGDWILFSAGSSLDLISPDGKFTRKLSSRRFSAYNFTKDGRAVYAIFHNTADPRHEWQVYDVNVATGAETIVTTVDLSPSVAALSALSIHPDGKRALTTVANFPFQIWTLEGFERTRATTWRAGWAAGQ